MVLPITLFRTPEGKKLLYESQQKRFKSTEIIDEIILIDEKVRAAIIPRNQMKQDINLLQKQISGLFKKSEDATELINNKIKLDQQLATLIETEKQYHLDRDKKLALVGNLIHPSVPISNNETENQVIRTWGNSNITLNQSHHKLIERIEGYDQNRGTKVTGHRGYFLTGVGVRLNLAIQQYAIDFLEDRGYKLLQPPYLMNSDMMAQTAELLDFEETLYNVSDDKFLIATSEQPISAYHQGETFNRKSLPIKYAGISTCFRKEAGAHGKENWGIFRVHQFEKIEQFCLADPDKSFELQEEMMKISEEFYQSLNLPYRVINIVSGALNLTAARKYDLEAWFPSYQSYRELVSCSNCTDYQSSNLNIRLEQKEGFVHLLNATLCATERTICAILENYQTEEGIIVPSVLRPYLRNLELIKFTK